jgi:DNA-binding transcriptional ArsR family regulator
MGQEMEQLLGGLRAAAEPTRLRLLRLCADAELTVSELTDILGQSQPRVSRHLKLLCEAGLVDRAREGSWVYYRLAEQGGGAELASRLLSLLPAGDAILSLDRERLDSAQRLRAEAAQAYFRTNAAQWDRIRSLYIDEREVEAALLEQLGDAPVNMLVDIGTGTGRMLEILAPHVGHALGIDLSREMLAVARANLERASLRNCTLRQGDMYQLPLAGAEIDAVIFHQVLHYADRPSRAIADFAPHQLDFLRKEHAHRHFGFADEEIAQWCREAGLVSGAPRHLPGSPLTVSLWLARRPATAERLEPAALAGAVP